MGKISHLHSYFGILTMGCKLMNDKCRIHFCRDMEFIVFNYFEALQYKRFSNMLSKYFYQLKLSVSSEVISVSSCFTNLLYFTNKDRINSRNYISPKNGKYCLLGACILLQKYSSGGVVLFIYRHSNKSTS